VFLLIFAFFHRGVKMSETRDCYVPHKMKYLVKIAKIIKFAFKGSKKNNHQTKTKKKTIIKSIRTSSLITNFRMNKVYKKQIFN